MLKGISPLISPELLKVLMEMGHGDEIVLADGNFPGASHAQLLVRCDGQPLPQLLESILQLFPLDPYVDSPVALMQVVPGDQVETPIWNSYRDIVDRKSEKLVPFEYVERFQFYTRAKKAYAVVMTGEKALYANIILKKGVIS